MAICLDIYKIGFNNARMVLFLSFPLQKRKVILAYANSNAVGCICFEAHYFFHRLPRLRHIDYNIFPLIVSTYANPATSQFIFWMWPTETKSLIFLHSFAFHHLFIKFSWTYLYYILLTGHCYLLFYFIPWRQTTRINPRRVCTHWKQ